MTAPVWNGVPKVVLTWGELLTLYSYCPQWQGVAEGPRLPWGEGAVARVSVDAIFQPTREKAEFVLRYQAEQSCIREGMTYNEDEWTITHLVLVNGC